MQCAIASKINYQKTEIKGGFFPGKIRDIFHVTRKRGLPVVHVDHLQKIKTKYKNLKKQDTQDIFIKMN